MDAYTQLANNSDKELIYFESDNISDRLFSNWEINSLTSKINSFYYKSEILNSIESLLLSGVLPENIWIINNSVDIHNQYSRYPQGIINTNTDVEKLYHLGVPISLKYSLDVYALNIYFSTFRELNHFLKLNKLNIIDKKPTLNIIYNTLITSHTTQINLTSFFKDLILSNNNNTITDNISDRLDNILSKYQKELSNNSEKKFFKIFQNLERPLIVVNQESSIQLLGFEMFKRSEFKKSNPRFLETNTISQNSPLIIGLTMSSLFITGLIGVAANRLEHYYNQVERNKELSSKQGEIHRLEKKIEKKEREIRLLENRSRNTPLPNNPNANTQNIDIYLNDLSNTRRSEENKFGTDLDQNDINIHF